MKITNADQTDKSRKFIGLPFLLGCMLIMALSPDTISYGDNMSSDLAKLDEVYRLYAESRKAFSGIHDISPQETMKLHENGTVVFVDTRKSPEMAVSMLPGAISSHDYLRRTELYAGKTVVVYCTISYRSGFFARQVAQQGSAVVNLKGGILAWILEGGKVYDPNGISVKRVHVYGNKWDYTPSGYESVKFGFWKQFSHAIEFGGQRHIA